MLKRIANSIEYRTGIKRKLKVAYSKAKLKLGLEEKIQINEWQDIPVIINNRNRYTFLLQLIEWLEKVGVRNIFILDNDSTYPPLLEYYQKTTNTILYHGRNVGKTSLWDSEYYKLFKHNYFIYTDPDVVPDENCPDDAIEFLWKKLKKYQWRTEKVGLGIKISDLPDHFNLKHQIISWEKQFWVNKVDDEIFAAPIDTTFALYRPYAPHNDCEGFRTGEPYLIKHLPWYLDYDNLSEEEQYYIKSATISSTIGFTLNEGVSYPNPEMVK